MRGGNDDDMASTDDDLASMAAEDDGVVEDAEPDHGVDEDLTSAILEMEGAFDAEVDGEAIGSVMNIDPDGDAEDCCLQEAGEFLTTARRISDAPAHENPLLNADIYQKYALFIAPCENFVLVTGCIHEVDVQGQN